MLRNLTLRRMGLFLLAFGLPAFAQQFSADMVREKPTSAPVSKVSVSGDKMRFEVSGPPPQQSSIVIIDLKAQTGYMVIPGNQSYTQLPTGNLSTAMPFFHGADPANACPAWDKLVSKSGSCTKEGDETVNGRDAVKYKGVDTRGDPGYAWVDRKLNFVTKWEGEKAAVEFQNIQEGPQPASLFEVPKSYDKMDSQAEHRAAVKAKSKKTSSPPRPSAPN